MNYNTPVIGPAMRYFDNPWMAAIEHPTLVGAALTTVGTITSYYRTIKKARGAFGAVATAVVTEANKVEELEEPPTTSGWTPNKAEIAVMTKNRGSTYYHNQMAHRRMYRGRRSSMRRVGRGRYGGLRGRYGRSYPRRRRYRRRYT